MLLRNIYKVITGNSGIELFCKQLSTDKRLYTVEYICQHWIRKFRTNRIEEPCESIENIVAHVLGSNKPSYVRSNPRKTLTHQQLKTIDELCTRRLGRMPIQYVIGEWQFRDLNLKMHSPVFIPRPETEQLVDLVLNHCASHRNVRNILDLCCGSGAIALALLNENPQIYATAVDRSKEACDLTQKNCYFLGLKDRLTVLQCEIGSNSLLENIDRKIDVIVSNPPYIFSQDLEVLPDEIRLYEDLKALDGGVEGLDVINPILRIASLKLEKTGRLFLEVDPRQPSLIDKHLDEYPTLRLRIENVFKDFCAKDRFVEIQRL